MSWLPTEASCAEVDRDFDAVFALHPELHARYREFEALFWQRRLVDPVVLELCRLRVAQLLECTSQLALRQLPALEAGLREARVELLAGWRESSEFSARERACLGFAEGFVLDPHAISDADVAAVVSHLATAGAVALAEALALFEGFARFRNLLEVEASRDLEIAAL